MGYYNYLCSQLSPLRLYDLTEGAGAEELKTAGAALDAFAAFLEETEQESSPLTAQGKGLEALEALLPYAPVSESLARRREAIAALLGIDGMSFTRAALNAALAGCGIPATVDETETPFTVAVTFPGTAGVPAAFPALKKRIEAILPCHLAVEYRFRYLQWKDLEQDFLTWSALESSFASWGELEAYSAE